MSRANISRDRLARALALAATRARDYAADLATIREVETDAAERHVISSDIKTALDDAERLTLLARSYGATT